MAIGGLCKTVFSNRQFFDIITIENKIPHRLMPAVPPVIPDSQELYNALMSKIEPELTTEGLKTLEAKYPSETPEQKKERIDRYNAAFEAYDKALEVYMSDLRKQVDGYRKAALG